MLTFIASPYTHSIKSHEEARYVAVTKFTMEGIRQGHALFSPIMYSHTGALLCGIGTTADEWIGFNKVMLSLCDNLLILGLDGWEESLGVRAEVIWMNEILERPCYVRTMGLSEMAYSEGLEQFWKDWRGNSRRIKSNVVGGYKMWREIDGLDRNAQTS